MTTLLNLFFSKYMALLQIILFAFEMDIFCHFYVWDKYFIESSSLNNKKEKKNFMESYHSTN